MITPVDDASQYTKWEHHEHVRNKGMWLGGREPIVQKEWLLTYDDQKNEIIKYASLMYVPAMENMIRELLSNIADVWLDCINTLTPITMAGVSVTKDGIITVWNNGRGIPVVEIERGTFRGYLPEMISSVPYTGDKLKNRGKVSAGTNGLGLKLVNMNSTWLTLETVDGTRGLYYHQKFSSTNDGLVIDRPTVTSLSDTPQNKRDPHTMICFRPDYESFGYKNGFTEELYGIVRALFRTRTAQLAAYFGQRVNVFFDGNLMNIRNLTDLARMFLWECKVKPPIVSETIEHIKYPWELTVAIGSLADVRDQHMTVVNGIYPRQGGTHLDYFKRQIHTKLKEKVAKVCKNADTRAINSMIDSNIIIFLSGMAEETEWSGQRKDQLTIKGTNFKDYLVSDGFIDRLWKHLKLRIEVMFSNKLKSVKKKKITVKNYTPAEYCTDRSKASACYLFLPEGASAKTTVKYILSHPASGVNYEYGGIYDLKGVLMNARKQVKILGGKTDKTDKTDRKSDQIPNSIVDQDKQCEFDRTEKLENNIILQGLVQCIGLDYTKKYDQSVSGIADFRALHYGSIIISSDQDVDGLNISALVTNFFYLFWPALITRGFIKRWETPIVRAYPKYGPPIEFIYEEDFEKWRMETISKEGNISQYRITYHKGLGGHDEEEKNSMAINFIKHVHTYTAHGHENFEVYYGKKTDLRKKVLSEPMLVFSAEYLAWMKDNHSIPLEFQLKHDAHIFQLDSLERKLHCFVDGSNSVRNKVFCASRLKWAHDNTAQKLSQFTGYVLERMDYQHAPESLSETIIHMSQTYPGGRTLPYFIGQGNFGSHIGLYAESGKSGIGMDHAAARYLHIQPNKALTNLLFPAEDDDLLEYVFEDGVRAQPKFYCPIICTAICEAFHIPGTGWKGEVHPRDVFSVLTNARNLIRGQPLAPMPISQYQFKGSIIQYKGKPTMIGLYNKVANAKTNDYLVTALPMGISTARFCAGLEHLVWSADDPKPGQYVESYKDKSSEKEVLIKITLRPDTYSMIEKTKGGTSLDPFIRYTKNYIVLSDNLNFVSPDSKVVCFTTYEEILLAWYPYRKKAYIDRHQRKILLAKYKIPFFENTIRFLTMRNQYCLGGLPRKEMESPALPSAPAHDKSTP